MCFFRLIDNLLHTTKALKGGKKKSRYLAQVKWITHVYLKISKKLDPITLESIHATHMKWYHLASAYNKNLKPSPSTQPIDPTPPPLVPLPPSPPLPSFSQFIRKCHVKPIPFLDFEENVIPTAAPISPTPHVPSLDIPSVMQKDDTEEDIIFKRMEYLQLLEESGAKPTKNPKLKPN